MEGSGQKRIAALRHEVHVLLVRHQLANQRLPLRQTLEAAVPRYATRITADRKQHLEVRTVFLLNVLGHFVAEAHGVGGLAGCDRCCAGKCDHCLSPWRISMKRRPRACTDTW